MFSISVDVNYERSTSEGQAVSAIGETAEKHKADLIVMGTRGRTGLGVYVAGECGGRCGASGAVLHPDDAAGCNVILPPIRLPKVFYK